MLLALWISNCHQSPEDIHTVTRQTSPRWLDQANFAYLQINEHNEKGTTYRPQQPRHHTVFHTVTTAINSEFDKLTQIVVLQHAYTKFGMQINNPCCFCILFDIGMFFVNWNDKLPNWQYSNEIIN